MKDEKIEEGGAAKDGRKESDSGKGDSTAKEEKDAAQDPRENGRDERLLRLAAEFDNYKKRVQHDLSDAKEAGKAELLGSMLTVMDEFDLMLVAASRSEDRALAKGIELLYANFKGMMEKCGLREIDVNGRFDPYKHEIMMVKESGKEDGHILEVIKKGYTLNDRLLRPASVIVSKRGSDDAGDGAATDDDKKD